LLQELIMKKVLIVDDQPDIRKLIRMTLEFEDYDIKEASTAPSGLEATKAWRPDVVLCDVMMPGDYDGVELCRRVKGQADLARTKVVMLTARGQARDLEEGQKAGADVYLVKPFSPTQLVDVVGNQVS
jgi:two-component system phosphate regulon response regulator PhoB